MLYFELVVSRSLVLEMDTNESTLRILVIQSYTTNIYLSQSLLESHETEL